MPNFVSARPNGPPAQGLKSRPRLKDGAGRYIVTSVGSYFFMPAITNLGVSGMRR